MHATFLEKTQLVSEVYEFSFAVEGRFRFQAGQYIELTLPSVKTGNKRWFTISSPPQKNVLSITTKIPATHASEYKIALDALKINDPTIISQPMGDFILPINQAQPLLFIAIGLGITPFMSMFRSGQANSFDIKLLYSSKAAEKPFNDELSSYLPNECILHSGARLTTKKIRELIPDYTRRMIYIAGPETGVQTLADQLRMQSTSLALVTDAFLGYT